MPASKSSMIRSPINSSAPNPVMMSVALTVPPSDEGGGTLCVTEGEIPLSQSHSQTIPQSASQTAPDRSPSPLSQSDISPHCGESPLTSGAGNRFFDRLKRLASASRFFELLFVFEKYDKALFFLCKHLIFKICECTVKLDIY